MKSKRGRRTVGWISISLGVIPCLIATGILAVDPSSVHAPDWILGLAGCVFITAGLAVLVGQKSNLTNLLAAFICFSFAAIALWVATDSSGTIEGGLPGLSAETNDRIGRWVFGIGSFVSAAIGLKAIQMFFRGETGDTKKSR